MKVFDADRTVMGRLATQVSQELMSGEEIIIVNAEKAIITGSATNIKARYRMKRSLTHPRKGPKYPKMPDMIVKRTIRGMIPYQKPSGRAAYRRLKVYIGIPREFQKKKVTPLKYPQKDLPAKYITVGEVSKHLGSKF